MEIREADLTIAKIFDEPPALPVGVVDISEFLPHGSGQSEHPGYAWERMPRWLAEIEESMAADTDKIITVDLCSSLPLFAQMLRGRSFKRAKARADELGGIWFSGPEPVDFDDPVLRKVHTAVSNHKVARKIIGSVTQEEIYLIEGVGDRAPEDAKAWLRERIKSKLLGRTYFYEQIHSGEDVEASWQIKFEQKPIESPLQSLISRMLIRTKEADIFARTIADLVDLKMEASGSQSKARASKQVVHDNPELATLSSQKEEAGDVLADCYIDALSGWITDRIFANERFKPTRFLSVDYSDPTEIAASSLQNTPESTQHMNLFSHAVKSLFSGSHLRLDVLEPLPLPDGSVNLITNFDGWPSWVDLDDYTDDELPVLEFAAAAVIYGWYEKLVQGGKMVIFPWSIDRSSERGVEFLKNVRSIVSLLIGHGIKTVMYNAEVLRDYMSESDEQAARNLSPIFAGNVEEVEALILDKPSDKLVERHKKSLEERLGKLATSRANQGLPDPRQLLSLVGFRFPDHAR